MYVCLIILLCLGYTIAFISRVFVILLYLLFYTTLHYNNNTIYNVKNIHPVYNVVVEK